MSGNDSNEKGKALNAEVTKLYWRTWWEISINGEKYHLQWWKYSISWRLHLPQINISLIEISIKISAGRIFLWNSSHGSLNSYGSKKSEMFLKKNNRAAVPGVSRMLGSLACETVRRWHQKRNSHWATGRGRNDRCNMGVSWKTEVAFQSAGRAFFPFFLNK